VFNIKYFKSSTLRRSKQWQVRALERRSCGVFFLMPSIKPRVILDPQMEEIHWSDCLVASLPLKIYLVCLTIQSRIWPLWIATFCPWAFPVHSKRLSWTVVSSINGKHDNNHSKPNKTCNYPSTNNRNKKCVKTQWRKKWRRAKSLSNGKPT
jgi:hypothetical protein